MASFRLIRLPNLILVALTMYGMERYFIQLAFTNYLEFNIFRFILFVIAILCITAAGNIINDYYDVEVDRINRPNKLIVTKSISLKNTLYLYYLLNFIAIAIGFSIDYVILLIFFIVIGLLWLYSFLFKRILLLGNILVSFLTALVPLITGFYFIRLENIEILQFFPFHLETNTNFISFFSVILALLAMLLNLAREIVKDMEDKEGDKFANAQTIVLKLGEKVAAGSVIIVVLFYLFFLSYLINNWLIEDIAQWKIAPLLLSAFACIFSIFLIVKSFHLKNLKAISLLLKIAMFLGVLSPLFWSYLI